MTVSKAILWSSLSAAALGAFGCDLFVGGRPREDRQVYVQRDPGYQSGPVYVDQQTTYYDQQPQYIDQQPQYVIIEQAPPPIRIENRPPQPSRDSIWIDGYWNWNNQRYVWQSGRYERPPQAGAVWIAPRYENVGGKTRYAPGRWSRDDQSNGRGRGRAGT